MLCEKPLHSNTVFAGAPREHHQNKLPEHHWDMKGTQKMKGRIKGTWNIHCRSRCQRGRMGFVSLRVLCLVVFVPHGAKEHHGTFPTGTTPTPSQSLTTIPSPCTPTHGMFPSDPTIPPPPPFSISIHHTVTVHPYPQTFVLVSRACNQLLPSHTHTQR